MQKNKILQLKWNSFSKKKNLNDAVLDKKKKKKLGQYNMTVDMFGPGPGVCPI